MHPTCNASEVSRLIGQRLGNRRRTARIFGVGKRSGFTWRDIIAEFLRDEDNGAGDDARFEDAPISTTYGGYYSGY
jgi:hypothetical protein